MISADSPSFTGWRIWVFYSSFICHFAAVSFARLRVCVIALVRGFFLVCPWGRVGEGRLDLSVAGCVSTCDGCE